MINRKRITQRLPWLLPLRKKQRKFFFYMKMRLDQNQYAKEVSKESLQYTIFETQFVMLNRNSGFDMEFQENKIFNLKLAASTINKVLIKPQETFSFWQLARFADKHTPYKEGLCLQYGKIVETYGGGLCQLSNMLFWLFLHAPLTIVERHPHRMEAFPSPQDNIPDGTDATVSEGWLDLKVKNETNATYQIEITFDDEHMYGRILSNQEHIYRYEVFEQNLCYYRKEGKVYQELAIYQRRINIRTQKYFENLLYNNLCEIGYQLTDELPIIEIGDER